MKASAMTDQDAAIDRIFRRAVVAEAVSWEGVPWEHQGRGRNGVDCVGYLVCVARALELEVPDDRTYGRSPSPRRLLLALDQACVRLSGGTPLDLAPDPQDKIDEVLAPGRVVVFAYAHGQPQHAAILTDEGFVHAQDRQSLPKDVEARTWSPSWRRRMHSVWGYRWRR